METVAEIKEYKNIKAKVNRIIWYSNQNKWGVLSVENTIKDENFKDVYITLTGNFDGVYEDCEIEFSGTLAVHQRYGTQITLSKINVVQNLNNKEGIINFLAKSAIKGISFQNAKKIYDTYTEKSIDIVLHDTNKILLISGIGQKTLDKVKKSVENYKRMEKLIKYCTDLGIPYSTIYKLDKELGEQALIVIKNDIYRALEHSENLTFKQVDAIALKMGIDIKDEKRAKACLKYTLRYTASFNSSTGVSSIELSKNFKKEMGVDAQDLYNCTINILESENEIVIENNIIYLNEFYKTEKFIAQAITNFVNRPKIEKEFKRSILEEEINNFPFQLNEQQVLSIKKCLLSAISVITAPPGAGKTTILKATANIFARHDYIVVPLAPTGKASRRLEECIGRKAYTIHKFLTTDMSFLQYKKVVIIIDESSMMDIDMFASLISNAGKDTRFILSGDIDQLPSVQIGNVLEDLINSKIVNVCRLTEIVRQKEGSNIIKSCQKVNKGIPLEECNLDDFIYEEYDNDETLKNSLMLFYRNELRNYDLSEIQVLTPYKIGTLGSNNLNKLISDEVNKEKHHEIFNFKLGDRVMQIINNYDKDVFNGETGIVSSITDTLNIDFGDKVISYEVEELDELILAYSCSVHKSQGSEYPVVFIVLDDSQSGFLLLRKILYTAISRGKQRVYILSKPYCVDKCVNNNYYKERITKLKEFLIEYNKRK